MSMGRFFTRSYSSKTCSHPNTRSQAGLWRTLQLRDREFPSLTVKDSSVST